LYQTLRERIVVHDPYFPSSPGASGKYGFVAVNYRREN